MSAMMEEEFKRWTAKRKAALVTEIMQSKTSVSEASRAYDLSPSEIEEWVNDGREGDVLGYIDSLERRSSG